MIGIAWLVWSQVTGHQKTAVSGDGVPISYSVYGKGEPALVFVHGWCADRYTWYHQVPYFDKKYKVVALDLAGHGSSGRQRQVYTQEAFGEDVAAVVRAVGCRKVILIGHSMSGTVILEANLLLKGKVAGLIAIDTLENFERIATPEQIRQYIDPIKEDFVKGTSAFVREMFPQNADPKLVDRVVAKVSSAVPSIALNALEYYFKTPVIPLLSGVDVPLWCLNADFWPSAPEINRKYLKSYNLRIIPGLGHFLMLEAPDEFNRQLEDIIQQIEK
ncbi:MAG: alpha/beta hydrolase [Candidatus Omnitrophica bacterium]|nr:alpha/beta hydrolase [Candidatus Omnitrophota bacterium]